MKHLILPALGLLLVGCSTPTVRNRWPKIEPGMTKADVVEKLGHADDFESSGGKLTLMYEMDRFTKCAVVLSSDGDDGKVEAKSCREDSDSRQQYESAIQYQRALSVQQYMQMRAMQPQSQSQPYQMPIYQPQRPTRTSCTSRWVAGQIVSDCNSHPTGIDSSIYQQH